MMNFQPIKIYSRNYVAWIGGNYHEFSDCFECPKKSLLKSSYQKNTCHNFPPKKSQNRKFQTLKNPLIIPVTWNPEYPPPPGSQGHKEGKKTQRAKKVVSDSLGLVDFAIGLVTSVFNLPDGQVMFFEEFE